MIINVQDTHAHGNTNTDLLTHPHLQTPDHCPWEESEVEVRHRAPRSIKDAVVDSDLGIPAMSINRRIPCFCCGCTLYPCDES